MVATFTTAAVPEHERAEYWQEIAGRHFLGLRTERKHRAPFFGTLASRDVGSVSVTFLHSSAQDVFRGPAEIARSMKDCFFIAMQLEGACLLRQNGHERIAQPGDIELLDATMPGSLSFDVDYRRVVIAIPHGALADRLVAPERVIGDVVRGDHGLGALASGYLRTFAHTELPDEARAASVEILIELLAMASNAPVAASSSNARCVREARRAAIRAYAAQHLADPRLSPRTVAARFRVSPRYLHGLFAETGESFMRWVLGRRLAQAHAALGDPHLRHRTITELALDAGFQDLTHFGRAFKAAYGASPRAWRRAMTQA